MEQKIDSGLSCFMMLIHILNVKVSKEQLEHLMALDEGTMNEVDMLSAAKLVKLKGKIRKLDEKQIIELGGPVIAKTKQEEFFIIGRVEKEKVMVLFPDKGTPSLISMEELSELWEGTIILLTNKGILDREAIFGFKWFIPTLLKFKREFIEILIAAFTIQIIGILTPLMTQVVVDKVLVHRSLSTLYVLTIGLFLSYLFETVLALAKNYVFTHTTNRVDVMLSHKLFGHLFSLPLRYFESRKVGETVARVRELDSIRSFLTGTPLSSLIDAFFIIVYIAVLFFYSVPLTFVVIASVPVFAMLSLIVTPMFKKRLDEKFNAGAEAQSYLVESITGVQTVKSFALEPKLERKWGDLQSDYVKAGYRTSMIASASNTLGQFIQKSFDLLILFLGAKAVMDGSFTVGQLVAFRMLAGRASGPVLRLVQLWQEYQQASMSVKRIGDIFNSVPEPKAEANKLSLPKINGVITFDRVSFRYRTDTPEVIKDMSFTIPEGMMIGVVGRSGSGKSTISKLIQRLYLPESGKIQIDGMDIALADPSWLRGQIGVVLQENFMFNGTIAENISIHCNQAGMEQIIAAAKIAGAHDFIMGMQDAYDTVIGEKGIGLSGGQKQRIAIARAIINNPRILIFDEATSALDYESESIIQNNLKEICKGRTVLIIAHRLSTLKDADRIMVVDRGRIVEYDTKDKLMEKKGLYYYLHNKQARGEVQ
ncbi:MAG: type I secretion system permease/ATPase [Lachnospiraceae bacterium]|nr:type I secretion system permease/ATPase [Lachnospiraceae bacterium]